MLTLIVALSTNNAIGKNNDLLWHLPNDFKRFKTVTSGHYIVMGRKTFESFPKPLPNRTHIIITRNKNYKVPKDCFVASNIEEALKLCPKNETVFIIGGGEIYKQSMDMVNVLDITRVHTTIQDADTFFPEIDLEKWKLVAQEHHFKDEKHAYDFTFETYHKL